MEQFNNIPEPELYYTGSINNRPQAEQFIVNVITNTPEPYRSQQVAEAYQRIVTFHTPQPTMYQTIANYLVDKIVPIAFRMLDLNNVFSLQTVKPDVIPGHGAYSQWYKTNVRSGTVDLLLESKDGKRDQWMLEYTDVDELRHINSLLIQWDYQLQTHESFQRSPKTMYSFTLEPLTHFELRLLCRLLIPKDLLVQQSPSYASSYFALLTGGIVPRSEDPTLDREKWKWIIQSLPLSLRVTAYEIIKVLKVSDNVVDHSNCYTVLYDPRWKSIVDIVVSRTKLEESIDVSMRVGTNTVVLQSVNPTVVEQNEDQINAIMGEMDAIKELYIVQSSPALGRQFYDYIPYLMYKYGNINRAPLPTQTVEQLQDVDDIQEIEILKYSDQELLDKYLPFYREDPIPTKYNTQSYTKTPFMSKQLLVQLIVDAYQPTELTWFIGNLKSCSNDNYFNVDGDRRGDLRRSLTPEQIIDDHNIFLAPPIYGSKRRCFQTSELEQAFRETEYGMEFLDPDWIPPPAGQLVSPAIDPISEQPLNRTFSMEIMLKLYSLLKRNSVRFNMAFGGDVRLRNLLNKLREGLKEYLNAKQTLDNEKRMIEGKPEWRNDLLIYFGWLFLFAMWIRFWKGPGTPYPTVWKEHKSETCEYRERDLHIEIELSVHGIMLTNLENGKPDLANFIKELPYIHLDWNTGEITKPTQAAAMRLMGAYTVEQIIDKVQYGQFCMAQATDFLSGTAFYYLTNVLEVPNDRIGDLLLYVMRLLRSYESQTIEGKRAVVESIDDAERKQLNVDVINQHINVLHVGEPGFVQQPPDLSNITATRHLPQGMAEILTT